MEYTTKDLAASNLAYIAKSIHELKTIFLNITSLNLPDDRWDLIDFQLQELAHLCEVFGLNLTILKANRMLRVLNEYKSNSELFTQDIHALNERFEDELSEIILHRVPPSRIRYYKQISLFGEKVANSFFSACSDIEEAGTCLSLGMATASVFHSMRVMEVGLRAIEKSLKIKTQPNWGASIAEMNKLIDPKTSTLTKEEISFYADCVAHLSTVKTAWRNPTMHVEKRYTIEEAEGILNAVKSFMFHISGKLMDDTYDNLLS